MPGDDGVDVLIFKSLLETLGASFDELVDLFGGRHDGLAASGRLVIGFSEVHTVEE